uniref:Uncharacterized protein n=1 Tax=Solanum lycopersicum TaxID=4081 RepID=A0A3Q7G7B2_SOLLC
MEFHYLQLQYSQENFFAPGAVEATNYWKFTSLDKWSTHRVLKNLSEKYGPIMYLQLGKVPTVIASFPHMEK